MPGGQPPGSSSSKYLWEGLDCEVIYYMFTVGANQMKAGGRGQTDDITWCGMLWK